MELPPPPTAPPPPRPPAESKDSQPDNGIAVAGLITSLVGLILSIVVVGGLVGFVGMILSSVGLRRSRDLGGRGRGAGIGGVCLGIMSMVASVGFAFVLVDMLQGGPEIERDGVVTRSTNTEFPPQDDIVDVRCETSESGRVARAIVELQNMSPEASAYAVVVMWDTDEREVTETSQRLITIDRTANTDAVDPNENVELTVIEPSGAALADTCRVVQIDRSSFLFLTE